MWYLLVFFMGCSDGGRAMQTIEFNTKDACIVAGNQVLSLGLVSCFSQTGVKAVCLYKGAM